MAARSRVCSSATLASKKQAIAEYTRRLPKGASSLFVLMLCTVLFSVRGSIRLCTFKFCIVLAYTFSDLSLLPKSICPAIGLKYIKQYDMIKTIQIAKENDQHELEKYAFGT